MSVSLWKWTEACDSKPCCGNCDECSEETEAEEQTMADYIDREAAIDIACGNCLLDCQLDIKTKALYCETVKNLIELPAADVKPVVHGKWLTVEDTMWCGGGYWKCSNCDQGFGFAAYFEADSWPFCPNCGADMREAQP